MVVDETRRPRQAANHNDSDQWERAQPLNKPFKVPDPQEFGCSNVHEMET